MYADEHPDGTQKDHFSQFLWEIRLPDRYHENYTEIASGPSAEPILRPTRESDPDSFRADSKSTVFPYRDVFGNVDHGDFGTGKGGSRTDP